MRRLAPTAPFVPVLGCLLVVALGCEKRAATHARAAAASTTSAVRPVAPVEVAEGPTVDVYVRADGVRVAGDALEEPALRAYLRRQAEAGALQVRLHASEGVPHERIVALLDLAREAGAEHAALASD
ncbi:MAG: hypothetical protein CMN31_26655 [Sandaracinus sp.]|nr:hypothetical protein [Sandaracinus sp.]MBJ74869.1 hypothetical protein [Sandaracinus sp.]HJK90764.1 hypothetical protein [Polyangiaceae bacterium LLY-WYZ-15_(1-7)]HJL29500.1 hypothetical protein [Polyangiaceae bacterium LLY-WYZ-15_(1-7)]HJL35754.1 hypothetical protein [Polyangiaceae bacterium LLY-WYZ-15_(1-7)]